MWFGKTQVTVTGTICDSPHQAMTRLSERLLALGGTLENEGREMIVGFTPAHTILGRSYLFGTWYGKVPVRLRVGATSQTQGGIIRVRLDCDLTSIQARFRWIFGGTSAIAILPVAVRGWQQDPSLLLVLLLPYVICLGNFLVLLMVLPNKLRRAFRVDGLWWEV